MGSAERRSVAVLLALLAFGSMLLLILRADAWGLGQGETALVSRATGVSGAKGDGSSPRVATSTDGRFVAFASDSANLDPDDADTTSDVFVRDLQDNTTTLVSRATGASGAKGDGPSDFPSISGDGRYVAFSSNASNLDPDDTDGNVDVFVRDLQNNTTTLVSRATGANGAKGDGTGSSEPSLSADGSSVAFTSNSSNLDPDDTDPGSDIYLRDLQADTTTLVSRATGASGSKGDGFSFQPSVSGDGGSVAFTSDATNLDPDDTGPSHDIFVRDLQQNTTALVSRATGASGTSGNATSVESTISGDGGFVSFTSADNLDPADSDANNDIYARDLQQSTTTLVSRATGANGAKANNGAFDSSVSEDGRFVAFRSGGSNLHPDDADSSIDVFVRDLQLNTTGLASRAAGTDGAKANGSSFDSSISADGSSVAFSSLATNLDPDDTDANLDVFLRDRRPFDSATENAPAAGTVSTNTTTSPDDPLGTSVTTPVAGTVTIAEGATTTSNPSGFALFGQEVQITAPSASAADPLVLQFRLDDSLLPPAADETNAEVFRNGALVADCDAGTSATPDPCVAGRSATASGLALTVRTSQASTWSFGLDSAPPNTTITFAPPNPTKDSTPTFRFSTNEPGSGFQCRFDAAAFAACSGATSHTPAGPLSNGFHTFQVTAVDQAQNPDPTPSSRTFAVDTVPPNTTITGGPSGKTHDPTPGFAFSSNAGNASFQCRLDNAAYSTCHSPKTVGPLADGQHKLFVRARDVAGNLDPTPAARTITVETMSVAKSGASLVISAATAVRDNIQISRLSPTVLRVTNLPAPPYAGSGLHAGTGCTRTGDSSANCSATGITTILVAAGSQNDRIVNETSIRSDFDGGGHNDVLVGGSGGDSLTGGGGADSMKGMEGNDQLFARDFVSDTLIACDGGATHGTVDKADLDKLPTDPNNVVTGCETTTRH